MNNRRLGIAKLKGLIKKKKNRQRRFTPELNLRKLLNFEPQFEIKYMGAVAGPVEQTACVNDLN